MLPKPIAVASIKSGQLEMFETTATGFFKLFKNDFIDLDIREKYFLGFDPENYRLQLPINSEIRSFLACIDRDVIGGLQLSENTLSFFTRGDFRRLGFATEMVTAATDHFLASCYSYRIWARTLRSNDASRRVLEKSGFREVCLEYRTLNNGFRVAIVLHEKS